MNVLFEGSTVDISAPRSQLIYASSRSPQRYFQSQ